MHEHLATLSSQERIKSKKLIDKLFTGGHSKSLSAFPMRAVYMTMEKDGEKPAMDTTQILVSVPKRCFKQAVNRNRVKRQVREAYRRHKALLQGHTIAVAFIWLDANLHTSQEVEKQMISLLRRIGERLNHKRPPADKQPEKEAGA